MLQVSFTDAVKNEYLADLKQAGELFKDFFSDNDVSVDYLILQRDSYPILLLLPDEKSSLQDIDECLEIVREQKCSSLRGVRLADIAIKLEDSDRHPASIALAASFDIVKDFARQLSALCKVVSAPQPVVA